MKKIVSLKAILIISCLALFMVGCENQNEEKMRHIVIFKYKPEATTEQIEKITNAFADLENKIPGIVAFEHGINDSPENKNKGFTHVYQVTFENSAARNAYLPHPEHRKFGELLGEMNILEDAFVVDYAPK